MHLTDGVLPFSMRHVLTRSVADEVNELRLAIADVRSIQAHNPAFRARLEEVRRTTDEEIASNVMHVIAGAMVGSFIGWVVLRSYQFTEKRLYSQNN